MNIQNSQQLFSRAQRSIPGGVNSPVRAFKSVGGTPLFMKHAKGAYLVDDRQDGNHCRRDGGSRQKTAGTHRRRQGKRKRHYCTTNCAQ